MRLQKNERIVVRGTAAQEVLIVGTSIKALSSAQVFESLVESTEQLVK